MDLTQNVGIVAKGLQKQITAYIVVSTSAPIAENVRVNSPKRRKKRLTDVLTPLLLSLLKTQKTEWGHMAMSTKEICRTINGVTDRSFCHFAFRHDNKTVKSWSKLRGCRNLKRSEIPCQFSYKQTYYVLQKLVAKGLVKTFLGKGLDLKKTKHGKVVSSDRYRYYQFIGG